MTASVLLMMMVVIFTSITEHSTSFESTMRMATSI
ncbi:hypothetical protein [Escherichia phage IMM-001]|nr:hypothetical protein [Escherichia phage IMM-001]